MLRIKPKISAEEQMLMTNIRTLEKDIDS
ncbi:hypothetical protein L195_g064539, partial [Trifolium pratense]